jgi:hypothetical protein
MKKSAALFFALIFSLTAVSQNGFRFVPADKKKVVIPFQLINNLIIVQVAVNGTKLNFLLDTGVDETILFSLDEQDEVKLYAVEKIKLKGLGGNEAVEGLKSSNNKISFPGYSDDNHDIYIVLDQNFNFSASIGIPVNGIIGYHFFKDNLIEINYDKKKITVHNDNPKIRKKIAGKFSAYDMSIEENKPYTLADITIKDREFSGKLLIDSGNTDAIWLFQDGKIPLPDNHFEDFLGRGLSGDILGERGRISAFSFHGTEFKNTLAAFPESDMIKNISLVKNRVGSVGAEILRRFAVIFDYKNNKIFLKEGQGIDQPFNYNMSGIEIHHEGMSWVKEQVELQPLKSTAQHEIAVVPSFTYKFDLKPIFAISNVRKNSPADLCGLKKGDILISINRTACYKYNLQEINALLKSEEGRTIEIEVERKMQVMKFRFRLKSMI